MREEREEREEGEGAEEEEGVGAKCTGSLGGSDSDTAPLLLLPSPGRDE